ncbi:MAG: hypothetical protein WC755_00015 [Candidatus Woesearchaeota archaeon]|jgi:hypothetical protein
MSNEVLRSKLEKEQFIELSSILRNTSLTFDAIINSASSSDAIYKNKYICLCYETEILLGIYCLRNIDSKNDEFFKVKNTIENTIKKYKLFLEKITNTESLEVSKIRTEEINVQINNIERIKEAIIARINLLNEIIAEINRISIVILNFKKVIKAGRPKSEFTSYLGNTIVFLNDLSIKSDKEIKSANFSQLIAFDKTISKLIPKLGKNPYFTESKIKNLTETMNKLNRIVTIGSTPEYIIDNSGMLILKTLEKYKTELEEYIKYLEIVKEKELASMLKEFTEEEKELINTIYLNKSEIMSIYLSHDGLKLILENLGRDNEEHKQILLNSLVTKINEFKIRINTILHLDKDLLELKNIAEFRKKANSTDFTIINKAYQLNEILSLCKLILESDMATITNNIHNVQKNITLKIISDELKRFSLGNNRNN